MSEMELVDRIEKRRFVGREFLLWLWFESEVFEGTLSTREHGSFGLWLERRIVLSLGKEATRIQGQSPASAREAKEALCLGKLPERAGLRLALAEQEASFDLRADTMALAGLALPTVLGDEEEAPALLEDKKPPPKKRRRGGPEAEEGDEAREAFYERMRLTADVEGVIEALYRDFLTLRLGDAWQTVVMPSLQAWVKGRGVNESTYRAGRDRALGGAKRR